jgi:dienelactone hydrolase
MHPSPSGWIEGPWSEREITISIAAGEIRGTLTLPSAAIGLAIFPQGSASSRHSTRNRTVAQVLQQARVGTLVFDLLTEYEERFDRVTRRLRSDIGLLSRRLLNVTTWVRTQPRIDWLPLGYHGVSTGAAAALVAAAKNRATIRAVVSRSSRPVLAGRSLRRVRAPTMLIAGGEDSRTIRSYQEAMRRMRCPVDLEVVPGATHLFEEPGALVRSAELAASWFTRHLPEE